MAGRNRMPRHADGFRGYRDDPQPVLHRGPQPFSIPRAALEEELIMQHREMQRIFSENRLVIDDNTLLQRELTDAKDEIHRLGQVIPKLRAEKEADKRELIERGLKLEADLRAVQPIRAEVVQLRAEIRKLNALRQELSTQVQGLTQEITRLQAENQQLVAVKTDIDGMRNELVETRRAFEYERKANEEQVQQKQAMEKNLISMAREIEQLRAEHMNTDRRAGGLGGGGYGIMNGGPEMRSSGALYGNVHRNSWGPYDRPGPRHYFLVKMESQKSQLEKPAVTTPTSPAAATPASCRKKKNEQATFLEDVKDHIDEFINASMDEHASCFRKTIDKMFKMSKIVADKNAADAKEVESSLPLQTTVAD